MTQLNKNIELIAVEGIAQSRVLLALKGIDINADGAECLSVLLSNQVAIPMEKVNTIALETKFNAYQFLNQEEKVAYLLLFNRILSDSNTQKINDLLTPEEA